jgi:ubiquinone/menaquinone biosynthesis C-methylase UbiE
MGDQKDATLKRSHGSMKIPTPDVTRHYASGDLEMKILTALSKAGKDVDALTVDDLAPVDEFHIRGRSATEELASWVNLRSDHLLLDVGCGLGGTCRYLAHNCGCEAVGLDLTPEYCRVAERLSERVGLTDQTRFQQGSALEIPFPDNHFGVVWTEHVQMNIQEKTGFYREVRRVLKRQGQFAFHDIFAGSGALHFPVPWADDDSISHLICVDEVQDLLTKVGLDPLRWEDKTAASIRFFETTFERVRDNGRPAVGLHLLMEENATERFANMLLNLQEGRVRVIQAVLRCT